MLFSLKWSNFHSVKSFWNSRTSSKILSLYLLTVFPCKNAMKHWRHILAVKHQCKGPKKADETLNQKHTRMVIDADAGDPHKHTPHNNVRNIFVGHLIFSYYDSQMHWHSFQVWRLWLNGRGWIFCDCFAPWLTCSGEQSDQNCSQVKYEVYNFKNDIHYAHCQEKSGKNCKSDESLTGFLNMLGTNRHLLAAVPHPFQMELSDWLKYLYTSERAQCIGPRTGVLQ